MFTNRVRKQNLIQYYRSAPRHNMAYVSMKSNDALSCMNIPNIQQYNGPCADIQISPSTNVVICDSIVSLEKKYRKSLTGRQLNRRYLFFVRQYIRLATTDIPNLDRKSNLD